MYFRTLLQLSQRHLEQYPDTVEPKFSLDIFNEGAYWMAKKMQESNDYQKVSFPTNTNFSLYGFSKYMLCLAAFMISFVFILKINPWLAPLSILVFYLVEIHFLFLFPLLIDKVKNPVCASIQLTYSVGIFKCLVTVIPLGFYMVIGLFQYKNPFKNWHLGCLAILIWYKDEVSARL